MTLLETDNPNSSPTLLIASKPTVKTSTKPSKSVGVKGTRINQSLLKAQNPSTLTTKELSDITSLKPIDSFNISYTDRESGPRVFNFSLPPAIDNILTYSASGSFRGNASVPDVKAGLPIRTTMKHRNIVIPGGTNVVQTIGIDSKYIVLVGAFFGTEEFSTKPKQTGTKTLATSYRFAKEFDERVVQQGAPITLKITINAASGKEEIEVTGVIVDFKAYAVRQAKTYYSITVLYTKYPKRKVADEEESKTTSNTDQSSTDTSKSKKQTEDKEISKFAASLVGKEWNSSLIDSLSAQGYLYSKGQKKQYDDTSKNYYEMFVYYKDKVNSSGETPYIKAKKGDPYIGFLVETKLNPDPIELKTVKNSITSYKIYYVE